MDALLLHPAMTERAAPLPGQVRESFEQLYRAHRADVYRWALRYSAGRRDVAEDLAQDVFVRLHAHLAKLERHEDLGAWLYRTTANRALNSRRSERSVLKALARLWRHEASDEPSPDARLSRRQLVLKTLGELPNRERVVMCMKVLDGMSQQDIARALSLSEGQVSKLVARAWAHIETVQWEESP